MSPEPTPFRLVFPRAFLAGAALGALCIAAAGLVLFDAVGLLAGATGLAATIAASLLMGVWAGAPQKDQGEQRLNERWVAAGIAAAVAGAYASFLVVIGLGAPTGPSRIITLLVLAALPAYVLGMLLPALLIWGERYEEELEDEPEGWGALGALVLGLLAGFSTGVLVSGSVLVVWIGPGPLLLIVAVMLLGPVVIPAPVIARSDERLLAEIFSPLSHIRVTEVVFPGERQPERRLYLGEEQESGELVRSGAPTLAYIVAAERWLTEHTPRGATYLFLGGGAFTLPRRIVERDPEARVTVVELDPEITRAAYRYFGLRQDHEIRVIHGDARAALDQETDEQWDRLYLDVYFGTEAIPYLLVTREAFAAMRRLLAPGGVLGINLIGITDGAGSRQLWSVLRTLSQELPHLAIYTHFGPDSADRQNLLVLASAEPLGEMPREMGIFDAWPEDGWRLDEGIVYHDLFPEFEPATE